jgi:hypothetical protein
MGSIRLVLSAAVVAVLGGAIFAYRFEARRSAELRDLHKRIDNLARAGHGDGLRPRVVRAERPPWRATAPGPPEDTADDSTRAPIPPAAEATPQTESEGPSESELFAEREAQFSSQRREGIWARDTESELRRSLDQRLTRWQLTQLECRSTTCKVTLHFETRQQYEGFVDSNLIHTSDAFWRGAFAFHIEESSDDGVAAVGFLDRS